MSKDFCYYCIWVNRKKKEQKGPTLLVQCTNDVANLEQASDMVYADDACDYYEAMSFNAIIDSEDEEGEDNVIND